MSVQSKNEPDALIDCHVHFDDPRFDGDRTNIYHRAQQAGISNFIVPSTIAANWSLTASICSKYAGCSPAYGLHPYFINIHRREHLDELVHFLEEPSTVAVGECGLDYFLPNLDRKKQQLFFDEQLSLAREFHLPIIIHARKAVDDVIQHIRSNKHENGMIHSFNGSKEQARQLIDLGYFLSFGGAITYARASRLRALISQLPLESLLIETDAPDQPPAKHSHELNEPAYLTEIFDTICELRNEDRSIIAQQLFENAQTLFK